MRSHSIETSSIQSRESGGRTVYDGRLGPVTRSHMRVPQPPVITQYSCLLLHGHLCFIPCQLGSAHRWPLRASGRLHFSLKFEAMMLDGAVLLNDFNYLQRLQIQFRFLVSCGLEALKGTVEEEGRKKKKGI